jgi:hypothetical protein
MRKAILADKAKEAKLIATIEAIASKLPHVDGIANFFLAWKEVAVAIGEPVEVETIKEGVSTKEMRTPTAMIAKWIVTPNHACQLSRGGGSGTSHEAKAIANKRAITVFKREGLALVEVGNFRTGQEACDHLKIATNGDSGNRKLKEEGYILEGWNGKPFTILR